MRIQIDGERGVRAGMVWRVTSERLARWTRVGWGLALACVVLLPAAVLLDYWSYPLSVRSQIATALAYVALVALVAALLLGAGVCAFVALSLRLGLAVGVVFISAVVLLMFVPWSSLFLSSRDADLDRVSRLVDQDTLSPGEELPGGVRYLSRDGHLHQQHGCLYLPLWQDWRGESGLGFARCPGDPSGIQFQTAPADLGNATQALSGGWWLIR